jgi:hypothetical protein|tara:strand:- start:352 stop:654 length:303 start_codon:yes stop_codon:yes gene_type:complete
MLVANTSDMSRSSFTTALILGAGLSLSYLSSFPSPPQIPNYRFTSYLLQNTSKLSTYKPLKNPSNSQYCEGFVFDNAGILAPARYLGLSFDPPANLQIHS